jgi:hypothetical protein
MTVRFTKEQLSYIARASENDALSMESSLIVAFFVDGDVESLDAALSAGWLEDHGSSLKNGFAHCAPLLWVVSDDPRRRELAGRWAAALGVNEADRIATLALQSICDLYPKVDVRGSGLVGALIRAGGDPYAAHDVSRRSAFTMLLMPPFNDPQALVEIAQARPDRFPRDQVQKSIFQQTRSQSYHN